MKGSDPLPGVGGAGLFVGATPAGDQGCDTRASSASVGARGSTDRVPPIRHATGLDRWLPTGAKYKIPPT